MTCIPSLVAMCRAHVTLRLRLQLFVFAALCAGASNADLIQTPTTDGATISSTVFNPAATNVTINSVTVVSGTGQIATFTNGLSVPGFISFEEGLIMGSGPVSDIVGPNAADGTSTNIPAVTGADADADFDSLTDATAGTFDAAYVVIDFTPTEDLLTGTFVFASEEYNEYAPPAGTSSAGNTFYDVMAFFVNGVNYSVTADGNDVSINTVNETLNAADFITNDRTDGVPTPVNIEPDGFTKLLVWTAPVNPGVSNTLKFGVADGGDSGFDSWLLIDKYSFKVLPSAVDVDLALTVTDNNTAVAVGETLSYQFSVQNLGPNTASREIEVVSTLPNGITINGGTAASVAESGPNGDEWTCTSDALTPQSVTCKSVVPLGTTNGNDTSVFTFQTDAVAAALDGQTLVNNATVNTTDNDLAAPNNSAFDSTVVTTTNTTGPILVISGAPASVSSVTPYTVTFQFNEDVTGFTLADIAAVNATVGSFTSVDAATYTASVTPDGVGDITLDVPLAAAVDGSGNDSQGGANCCHDVQFECHCRDNQ